MGISFRPLHGLWNAITRVLLPRRSLTTPTLSLVIAQSGATNVERAEPQLRWADPHRAPDGDYAASAIPNAELDITDVPRPGESWEAVSDFALSYDGYGYWDDLATLAGRVLQHWTRRRALPDTLDELRGCLFYEQRRWNHFGEEPTGRSAEYMWAMVDTIGALAVPAPTTDRIADPRRAIAPEAHVKLVATRAVALRPVPSPALSVRPLSARAGRLVPVPAAEAHVRLVCSIEEEAGAMSRHPSSYAARRSSGHQSGNPADHPAMSGAVRDLRPMPSAEPLPKPPVIVRRARRALGAAPNRPGGALHPGRPTRADSWMSNGSPRKLEKVAEPAAAAAVTPLCHEFFIDDAAYATWMDAHPEGFVLNQPRSAPSKAPTLHRVGCAVVVARPDPEAPGQRAGTTGTVRVCGLSVDALGTWSMARGTGRPTPCRRCCP
jgi:hypothetical protein